MKFSSWIVAGLALAGCASTQRTLTYPATMPDADVMVGVHRYQVWFHPRERTILLQRGAPAPLGQTLAQNLTLYAADRSEPVPVWRAAADAVLHDLGCQASDITGADQMREAHYICVSEIEVAEAVAAKRADWRRGVRVDDPTMAQR